MADKVANSAIAAGIALATAAAGPLFTLPVVAITAFGRGTSIASIVGGSIFVLIVSVPFGAIIALIPNTLGATALVLAGRRFSVARHPVVWAIAGALLGASIGLVAGKGGPLACGWTGAACALLCRWRIRRIDQAPVLQGCRLP